MMRGDANAAVEAFREALDSDQAVGDVAKALGYDLAAAWEQAGQLGRALYRYQQVAAIDPGFRDVQAQIARLVGMALPEDDDSGKGSGGKGGPPSAAAKRPVSSNGIPAAKKPETPAAPGPKSRKVGYL
jgi:hypothetical protein